MDKEKTENVIRLAEKVGHVLIATADQKGSPHMASSGRMELQRDGRLSLSEWFCPGTLSNLQHNPRISVVVWDPESDFGYQLLGETEGIEETAMQDGYSPLLETSRIPQVERKILFRVDRILHFSLAPHSDIEE